MKNLQELVNGEVLNFDGIESPFFLLGLISAFENRYQAKADNFFECIDEKDIQTVIRTFFQMEKNLEEVE